MTRRDEVIATLRSHEAELRSRGVSGLFLFGSPAEMFKAFRDNPKIEAALAYRTSLGTWVVMTVISAFAILMLPRQFYVTFVENRNIGELRHASRVFPLYLVAINLFVLPIAFGALNDLTGVWSSCFMLLFVVVAACLAWMHVAILRIEQARALAERAIASPAE